MAITEEKMRALLTPYLAGLAAGTPVPDRLYEQLGVYLQVLERWNARTNLTAVRAPEEIVQRHFGESLFAAGVLAERLGEGRDGLSGCEVLDLGSGAGFPGVPTQLLLPELRVTLAESQGKKAAFLREVVRALGLAAEVWSGRAEAMPAERKFDAVMLRAVDRMGAMVEAGQARVRPGGVLLEMVGGEEPGRDCVAMPERAGSWVCVTRHE